MEISESVRLVVVQEISHFLRQFRVDQNAAREADRRFYAEQIDAIHSRIDRSERMLMSPNASASTSITSSSWNSCHSPQELGSPTLHADSLAEPPEEWDDRRLACWGGAAPFNSVDVETINFFSDNDADEHSSAGLAAMSGSNCQHTDSDRATVYAGACRTAALEPQEHVSRFPPPLSSQGLFAAPIVAAQTAATQPTNVQFPLMQELAISSAGERPAQPAVVISSIPGHKEHNPRVCALCRFAFKETK